MSHLLPVLLLFFFSFFFNAPATTEIYTLSLHDALPIFGDPDAIESLRRLTGPLILRRLKTDRSIIAEDRKSTRLNSSHGYISYAVFCLKKKKHIEIS